MVPIGTRKHRGARREPGRGPLGEITPEMGHAYCVRRTPNLTALQSASIALPARRCLRTDCPALSVTCGRAPPAPRAHAHCEPLAVVSRAGREPPPPGRVLPVAVSAAARGPREARRFRAREGPVLVRICREVCHVPASRRVESGGGRGDRGGLGRAGPSPAAGGRAGVGSPASPSTRTCLS